MQLSKIAGERNPECNSNVVLFPATEPLDGVVIVYVPDKEVEVLITISELIHESHDILKIR